MKKRRNGEWELRRWKCWTEESHWWWRKRELVGFEEGIWSWSRNWGDLFDRIVMIQWVFVEILWRGEEEKKLYEKFEHGGTLGVKETKEDSFIWIYEFRLYIYELIVENTPICRAPKTNSPQTHLLSLCSPKYQLPFLFTAYFPQKYLLCWVLRADWSALLGHLSPIRKQRGLKKTTKQRQQTLSFKNKGLLLLLEIHPLIGKNRIFVHFIEFLWACELSLAFKI